jgi:hypothetical protein
LHGNKHHMKIKNNNPQYPSSINLIFGTMNIPIVGTDLSAVITWVGLGLCAAEPHHFSSCVRVN